MKNEVFVSGELRYEHLLGRKFDHGVVDCYSLLMDLFKDNFGILLDNFARPDDWWIHSQNLYMDNFSSQGFSIVDIDVKDLCPFDVLLIALPDSRNMGETVANHCAIYLGDGLIIHHRLGKLSEVIQYRYALKDLTVCVIRHKDIPDLRNKTRTEADLMDFLLPHKRALLMGALNDRKNNTGS